MMELIIIALIAWIFVSYLPDDIDLLASFRNMFAFFYSALASIFLGAGEHFAEIANELSDEKRKNEDS